jgi:hypothetical protein
VKLKTAQEIEQLIRDVVRNHVIVGNKSSRDVLQSNICAALVKGGYQVDYEDKHYKILSSAKAVWRNRDRKVHFHKRRPRIDLCVYQNDEVAALVEVEACLDGLPRKKWAPARKGSGNYYVLSIAKDKNGEFFESYKSIERMAVAAMALAGRPSDQQSLEQIRSNRIADHNPSRVPLFLVTEWRRASDKHIIEDRLASLGATLISKEKRD